MTSPPRIELDKEFSDQLTVHKNIGQEIVVTTVDKVRICLMETRDCLTTKREWATPLALCLALLSTLVAADFRDYLLPKAVWQAMYILACQGRLGRMAKPQERFDRRDRSSSEGERGPWRR